VPDDLRNLPPVEPVELPQRLSQTLLAHANACRRSAWLYLRRRGGVPAVELDFGTAAHLVFERIVSDLIATGERALYAAAEGEDQESAAKQVASLSAAVVDEVLRERRDLQVPIAHPTHSVDHLREQAYHFAATTPVDPETVLGLEQKFALELPSGWTVVGKLDVAEDLGGGLLGVTDYKTVFNAETEGEFADKFQGKMYALLLLFGTPLGPDDEPVAGGVPAAERVAPPCGVDQLDGAGGGGCPVVGPHGRGGEGDEEGVEGVRDGARPDPLRQGQGARLRVGREARGEGLAGA
jgi:hypothetical protein